MTATFWKQLSQHVHAENVSSKKDLNYL